MLYLYIAIGVVAFVLLTALALFLAVFYSPYTKPQFDVREVPRGKGYDEYRDKMLSMIDELAAYKTETVVIMSRDGLFLQGKYIHVADGAPLDIMIHGYRGLAVRDFSGGAVARIKAGHNVLLAEQRAHENSGGHIITFGIRERYDVLAWTNYAVKRFGQDVAITLFGISMGAATVLMASELELPTQVKAICADCPYSSPKAIIKNTCKSCKVPSWLAYPVIWLGVLLYGHFNLSDGSAVEAVKHSKLPILLMHGKDDVFVPCKMSEEIAKANPDKTELHLWDGAMHGMSFVVHTEEYLQIERAFLDKYIGSASEDLSKTA